MKNLRDEVIVGIDYSMTSPAICIGANSREFDLYGFVGKKSHDHLYVDGDMCMNLYDKHIYSCDMERFEKLANWTLEILGMYEVGKIILEGYSYGSKGTVFNIGENTGILKYGLWKSGYVLETIPPTSIKKFATGKGTAKKEDMGKSFYQETGKNLPQLLESDWGKSPVSDLVDSYWMMRYGMDESGSV